MASPAPHHPLPWWGLGLALPYPTLPFALLGQPSVGPCFQTWSFPSSGAAQPLSAHLPTSIFAWTPVSSLDTPQQPCEPLCL